MSLQKRYLVCFFVILLPALVLGAFGPSEAALPDGGGSSRYQLQVERDLITLRARNVPLTEIFQDIAEASDMQVKFRRNSDALVTVDKRGVKLPELLKALSINYAYIEGSGRGGSPSKMLYLLPSGSAELAGGALDMSVSPPQSASAMDGYSLPNAPTSRKSASSASAQRSVAPKVERVSNELLVRFSPQATAEQIAALNDALSAGIVKQIPQLKIYRLSFPDGSDMEAVKQRYAESSLTQKVEPNYVARVPVQKVNDPKSGEQWNLQKARVPEAWSISAGSPDVVIAVVDTGVDAEHPDLAHQLQSGYDVLTGTHGIPVDDNGHGTQMAAIIAAEGNNALGVAGVSWKSRIMPIKVLDAGGAGSYTDIIEGLIYAADHGADIINLSLGGYAYSEMMSDAVQYAHDKNVVIVAGAGNDGSNYPIYPAALPHVLGVVATGETDEKWSYSNFGGFVDLAAPGVGILSATVGGGYGYASGTSQAAAFVSGVAALVKAANGTFTNTQVEDRLQSSADDLGASGRDVLFGAGRVNALRALSSRR